MNQNNDAKIKCSNPEHFDDVKFACFNESCKADRLYFFQCIKNGTHISHPQNQQELPFLFEHIQRIEKQCEDLIKNLKKIIDAAHQQFNLLIEGIRSKYKKSKQEFLTLNSKQMNSFFTQSIQFNSFEKIILLQTQQSLKDFQDSIEKSLSDLKLYFHLVLLQNNYI
ncbi:unnamed protein product [Paramecium pentaurelia]|uniref:Uncharacterized protein n=1 Tax=Paramecium pentaurelia TaxID=43138 RepID=A0A8S1VTZ4_9CILI|nr:unnamed protein product [Paramecium pentaurelia]